jgi:heavy metal sensor kinase
VFFKSIRFKIIVLYMLMSAVTLSLFSFLLYRNFSFSLYKNMDDLLRLKAAGIVNSIETYWETERMEVTRTQAQSNIFTKVNNVNFERIADRWIKDKSNDPELINIVVYIYDANGRPVASSKELPSGVTFKTDVFQYVLKGNPRFDDFRIQSSQGHNSDLRVLTTPVIEHKRVAYIVQVASPLASINSELGNLRTILLLLVPLTVLVTGIAGSLLVRVTLNPVDDMVRAIREIKADNLKLRIAVPNTNDEIRRLGETFNEMLGRLEKSFSSQQQFIQDISHELKTPLTVLRGELEVTLKKNRPAEEYAQILRSNLEEIDKIRRIVENLLILARLDTKGMAIEDKPVDLSRMLGAIADHIKVLADQKQIALNAVTPPGISLKGQEAQLRRLFVNLIDNAIKYTPPKGKVVVSLKKDNGLAIAEVSDTGQGIPQADLPYIFDRFYRVDKARSSEGFGLGLSIAKSIALAHKGDIKVRSHEGLGTTFTVFLPLA